MEQFSLEKWLQDKSRKAVTRDGREVDIYYSPTSRIPLIGRTSDNEIHQYTENGFQNEMTNQAKNDLFFADEKEQVTEFEKEIEAIIDENIKRNIGLKFEVRNLLNLARKEIEKEDFEFKPKFTYNEKDYSELANKLIEFRNNTPLCSVTYRDGEGRKVILHYEKEILNLARKEILKDLPKWKKVNVFVSNQFGLATLNDDLIITQNGYQIKLSDLKTLPKEE